MRLFFLHIAKCGGTSLRKAMTDALLEAGAAPHSLFYLDGEAAYHAAKEESLAIYDYRDKVLRYALASRYTRFVTGHFRFNRTLHDSFRKNWVFATVLRDPVDRFLSLLHYNQSKDSEYARLDDDIEAYLDSARARSEADAMANCFLSRERHFAPLSEADVAQACDNLAQFQLIGILEDLTGFRRRFQARFGQSLNIPALNRSPAGEERHEPLPDELMRRVQNLCASSRAVYDEARRLIAAREVKTRNSAGEHRITGP